jgi:outer membrane lipoprotein
MEKRALFYPLLLIFGFVFGCAPVVSTELKAGADTSLSFKEVQENPEIYKGKIVFWGGEIIQLLPQQNGTTLIEVLEWPLDWSGKPRKTVEFLGRFVISAKEPLDTSLYKRGNRITIAGEIQGQIEGSKMRELTDSTYRYPVLLEKKMHVWKRPSYPYSNVPDYLTTWEYHPTLR